jgi:hypothetical protein
MIGLLKIVVKKIEELDNVGRFGKALGFLLYIFS